ncbi:MAG TPA: cytochrome bd-I ubiquinol oxidase subunit CydA, partial [Paraburkholderia sp.]|nr:cytochrome bd-I ubiquinol oxidase subunit CydA [Paraburkholderia sp.]
SASSLAPSDVIVSIAGFVVFYTLLFIIEIALMFKYARLGPSSLHTGRYFHEQDLNAQPSDHLVT